MATDGEQYAASVKEAGRKAEKAQKEHEQKMKQQQEEHADHMKSFGY